MSTRSTIRGPTNPEKLAWLLGLLPAAAPASASPRGTGKFPEEGDQI